MMMSKKFSNLESQPEGPPGPGLADHVASDRPLGHEQTHLVLPQPVADKYKYKYDKYEQVHIYPASSTCCRSSWHSTHVWPPAS